MNQPRDAADLASIERVLALHRSYPEKTPDELIEQLIRNCCVDVARRSAATAGLAVLPSLGMIASLAVGALGNASAGQQSQVEMVLDIATIYRYPFRPQEKQYYLALALGLATGKQQQTNQSATDQVIAQGGQRLASQAKQRLARASVGRALPVVNMASAAGSNVIMTYAAAQRAKHYIKYGPDSIGDMQSDINALLKSDELKLSEWTMESVSQSMANLSDTMIENFDQGAQELGRAAGRATRRFKNFWRNATTPKG